MTSPTLTDIPDIEPVLDLATLPDLDAVDGTDTELPIETAVEPTAIEPPIDITPTPITPSTQADKIAGAVLGWLADIERLPELNARLDEIQAASKAVYEEYSRGISEVNKRFSDSLRPLDAERKELESQVAAAEVAKEQLNKLAGLIQEPTTTTKE